MESTGEGEINSRKMHKEIETLDWTVEVAR